MSAPEYVIRIEAERKKEMLKTLFKKSGSHKTRRQSPLKRLN